MLSIPLIKLYARIILQITTLTVFSRQYGSILKTDFSILSQIIHKLSTVSPQFLCVFMQNSVICCLMVFMIEIDYCVRINLLNRNT